MRLIDEDKLLLDIIDRGVDQIQTDDYAEICQIIAEQPTIQAVPIEVLQEIRAELTKHYVDPYNRNAFRYTTVSLLEVLDLIDKHINNRQFERIWQNTVKEMKQRKIGE